MKTLPRPPLLWLPRSPWRRGFPALVFTSLVTACDRELQEETDAALQEAIPETNEPSPLERAAAALDDALSEPGLPGAPGFEASRAAILARAKGEPIVLDRTPEPAISQGPASYLRQKVESTSYPWEVLKMLEPRFGRDPDLGRETLLRDGYLYAEDPDLAFALVSQIGLGHLFSADRVWIQRGEAVLHARRVESGKYVYESGRLEGEVVKLLHLDRVGTGHPPPPAHIDLRSVRYRAHFDRARILHVTENRVVAELVYGTYRVPTVLERNGARLEIAHEVIDPEQAADLARAREEARRRFRAVGAVQQAIVDQVYEGLPFDEPLTEIGQQDGRLRPVWVYRYLRNHESYRFQGDRYSIFDDEGRPLVPQVCADFLVDTYERASGTWWRPKGSRPGRIKGRLDLEEDRNQLRRTKELVLFFERHADWFRVRSIPEGERIAMGDKPRFFSWITEHADLFQPGSVVLIRGLTPWDPVEEHTHAFFVLETDPITGVPVAIAGNPGRPRIWSWETEARRTPLRTVRHVVQPKLVWLERVVDLEFDWAGTPPPLAVEASSRPRW